MSIGIASDDAAAGSRHEAALAAQCRRNANPHHDYTICYLLVACARTVQCPLPFLAVPVSVMMMLPRRAYRSCAVLVPCPGASSGAILPGYGVSGAIASTACLHVLPPWPCTIWDLSSRRLAHHSIYFDLRDSLPVTTVFYRVGQAMSLVLPVTVIISNPSLRVHTKTDTALPNSGKEVLREET